VITIACEESSECFIALWSQQQILHQGKFVNAILSQATLTDYHCTMS